MTNPDRRQIFVKAGLPIAFAWLLIPVTFLLPRIDSTREPFFDLTESAAQLSYWVSLTASSSGAPWLGLVLLAILISRSGITAGRRWREAFAILLATGIFAGGGAAFNEHLMKEKLEVPRPNIIWLAGTTGSGPLAMTPREFYNSGDKSVRSEILRPVLQQRPEPVALSPRIEAHWIDETGYSFPSGHSSAAFYFATYFLLMAATYVASLRFRAFYLLLPWAVAVCYSRPILRLHTPADITVGALQGLLLGVVVWLISTTIIRKLTGDTA